MDAGDQRRTVGSPRRDHSDLAGHQPVCARPPLRRVDGAFWLPLDGGGRATMALTGLVSIMFGVVMFAKPGDGALVLLALNAAFALVRGISELVVAIGWDRILERGHNRAVKRAKARLQPAS